MSDNGMMTMGADELSSFEPVFLQSVTGRDEKKDEGTFTARGITDTGMTDRYRFTAALMDALVRFCMTKEILIGIKLQSGVIPFAMKVDTALSAQYFAGIVEERLKEAEKAAGADEGTGRNTDFEPPIVLSFDEIIPAGGSVLTSICVNDEGMSISYDPGMYSEEYMDSFHKSLKQIYDEIRSQKALKDIRLVPENNESRSIALKNEGTVNAVFERIVRNNPGKGILFATDRTMTCIELDEEADLLAGALFKRGVGIGDRILILMRRRTG